MSDPDAARHVEIKDGDRMVAAAEVTTARGPEGTARTSLRAISGTFPPATGPTWSMPSWTPLRSRRAPA